MSSYPLQIDDFRLKENLPGMIYDAEKKTTLYVEDLTSIESAVLALENTLGIEPYGLYGDVSARLNDVDQYIAGINFNLENGLASKQDSLGFVAENVANKDTTTTLGTSDTKYPSQKAVKTYVDARNIQYSTNEVDTGKRWINGEIIYRKVIDATFNAAYGYISIPHGITGLTSTRKIISVGGGLSIGTTSASIIHTFHYADPDGNFLQMIALGLDSIDFSCSYSYGMSRATIVLEYTKS